MEKPNLSIVSASDPEEGPASPPATNGAIEADQAPPTAAPAAPPARPNPFTLAHSKNWKDLAAELRIDLEELVARYPDIASNYTILSIFDKTTSIGSIELDRIYSGLTARNGKHERDVLLLLLSTGGSVEPAYRISKICKYFARGKFAVCVPRYAKSAATLISLGADEIHMGRLGELGPIDPQVQGLPALAVGRALEALAQLAQAYPGSSQMLADYLRQQLKVQQIGHFERVAESAVQYAQRLLGAKHSAGVLSAEPELIAKKLVHDYKDHGFVIDVDESRDLLGERWIREDSQETRFADDFYSLFDRYNWLLEMAGDSTLLLIGSLHGDDIARTFWAYPKKPRDS